ncbi:endo-1,4-beta-xylanase [Stenotrophomonas tumulicola]|uniref:Beta-xylanase n=1 Tax=Stenotrophomonas tumulicola TaxID=1685415 RepID=A0A7W3IHF8_9GAMM|nr:endo-1,4-beta-xylanase [Stenotrophomonas tumulicola]MBA8681156.1 endo-1,4-beta-xylanase [Stenotrophomonas tumulicola]
MKRPALLHRPRPALRLAALLSCMALAPLASAAAPPAHATLKQAYANDFLVGVALDDDQVHGREAGAQALVLQQFDSITAENEMKPERLHPAPDVYDFSRGDAFVEFGRRNGLFVVGHTLLWHVQTPGWMFTDSAGRPNTAEVQLQRLRDYIDTVAGHYAGRVQAWDVANEVIDEDGSYRQSPWLTNVGDGDRLLREAFAAAARADPQAELYYNDFNTFKPEKRAGIVRLVKMLQAAGLRIDGVGMQGHWGIDGPSIAEIEQTIDAFAALGVKVMITELDVDVLPRPEMADGLDADRHVELPDDPVVRQRLDPYADGLPAEAQQRLATRYAELFALFQRKRDVIGRVTFWGLHDGQSWKNGFPVKGRTNHPLLFDRHLKPKPALEAVIQVPAASAASTR